MFLTKDYYDSIDAVITPLIAIVDKIAMDSSIIRFLDKNYGLSGRTIPFLVGNDLTRCISGMGYNLNQEEEATLPIVLFANHLAGDQIDSYEVARVVFQRDDMVQIFFNIIDSFSTCVKDHSSPLFFASVLMNYSKHLGHDYIKLLYDVAYAASRADGEAPASATCWLQNTLKPMRSDEEEKLEQIGELSLSDISDEDYFFVSKQIVNDIIEFTRLLSNDKVFRDFLFEHIQSLSGSTPQDCKQRLAFWLGREIRKCYNMLNVNYHIPSKQSTLILLYTVMLADDTGCDFSTFSLINNTGPVRDTCLEAIDELANDQFENNFSSLCTFKFFSVEYLDAWKRLLKMVVRIICMDDYSSIQRMNSIIESESDRTDLLERLGLGNAFTQEANGTLNETPSCSPEIFEFKIEKAFFIATRGTAVTGRVMSGKASVGEPVMIEYADGRIAYSEITRLEKYKEDLSFVKEGDCAGMYLKEITKEDLDGAVSITTI